MNRTFIGGTVIVMIVVGILVSSLGSTTEYISEKEVETIVEEVHPDWAKDEDAVKAAQAVIRKKELEAQESDLVRQITELQDELDGVRKELGTY